MLTNLLATVFITLSTNWTDLGVVKSGEDSFTVKAGVIQTNYIAEISGVPVKLSKVEFCRELVYKQEKVEYPIIHFNGRFTVPYYFTNNTFNGTNLSIIQ